MRLEFEELAVRRSKEGGSNIYGTPSIADQRAFVTMEVAKVKNFAHTGDSLIHEKPGEIVEQDVIVGDDNEDWNLEGTRMAEDVLTIGLQGKMRTLEENCRSTSIEASTDKLSVVALAERSLDL